MAVPIREMEWGWRTAASMDSAGGSAALVAVYAWRPSADAPPTLLYAHAPGDGAGPQVSVRGARLGLRAPVSALRWAPPPAAGHPPQLWIGTLNGELRVYDPVSRRVRFTERAFAAGVPVASLSVTSTSTCTCTSTSIWSHSSMVVAVSDAGAVRLLSVRPWDDPPGADAPTDSGPGLGRLCWAPPLARDRLARAGAGSAPMVAVARGPRTGDALRGRAAAASPTLYADDAHEWRVLAATARPGFLARFADPRSAADGSPAAPLPASASASAAAAAAVSSVLTLARSWWGAAEAPSPLPLPADPATAAALAPLAAASLEPRGRVEDPRRVATALVTEPSGRRALVPDSLGRLCVYDAHLAALTVVLKGYRHCSCAWLHLPPAPDAPAAAPPPLGFVLHLPRRARVELWVLRPLARLAVLEAPAGALLLCDLEDGPDGGPLCRAYLRTTDARILELAPVESPAVAVGDSAQN